MSSPSGCNYSQLIPNPTGVIYRFFNQPIEQIPKWDANKFQVLAHPSGGGLHWLTAEACTGVITCIRLEESGLEFDVATIFALKIVESGSGCPPILTVECPSGSNLV